MSWPPPLSAYDRSVPAPPGRPDLAERFADLRVARQRVQPPVDLRSVRQVAVVSSSSRGGSTHLEALLRCVPGVLTLPGEVNPLVVVAQLGDPADSGRVLADELSLQIGRPLDRPAVVDAEDGADDRGDRVEAFVLDVAWRLAAQHPEIRLPLGAVRNAVERALADQPAGPLDAARLTRDVLSGLPEVPLAGYDLPGVQPPRFPPCDTVVEMAPYVPLRPWRRASPQEVAAGTLLLATPRMVYRLEEVRALFPAARVRLVHLVRNPASAVNGLVDGWLHPAFATVPVPEPLRIRGYSDRMPGGERWWKFDVPLQWESLGERPLPEVCAAQWCEAHTRVLADRDADRAVRVRHEDLVAGGDRAVAAAERLADGLGLDRDAVRKAVCSGAPPVMATAPPAPARWRRREAELAAVLQDPGVLDLSDRLGTGTDPEGWE